MLMAVTEHGEKWQPNAHPLVFTESFSLTLVFTEFTESVHWLLRVNDYIVRNSGRESEWLQGHLSLFNVSI